MFFQNFLAFLWAAVTISTSQSTDGIHSLVKRRLPDHVNDFSFRLLENQTKPIASATNATNDQYTITSVAPGKIQIEGNSLIALASGLHRYLTDTMHVDIWWGIGSRLDTGPAILPPLDQPVKGSSIVPWRYHFNTVTFSYTAAFWTWEDWELELDWLALRGVNLPLAWVGQEKVLVEAFRQVGMTDAEISTYLSGPAFQAWNRFGNIQGSWGGDLPMEWIDDQFELQKNITARMVELGMTPVLPCFTGFVPRAITRVIPNANVVNGSQWSGFHTEFTNVTFLEPVDPVFADIQKNFISKQADAYGNITHVYTLDQFNENDPSSGDLEYLRNVSYNTWKSLKAADSEAIWLMQGWLFFSNSAFWNISRIEAYLGGVEDDSDMLILDLFSESAPQWQRTNSYFGKPWIWCQLHDYGGNMGLYGQVMNVTENPIEALSNSSSLVGFGLTPEGQEGNEIMYDLLLDQAWSGSPIDTATYFHDWVTRRYSGTGDVPQELYSAWDTMHSTVYNNTDLATSAVTKSILELSPNITGMLNRTGHHPTTITYDPATLVGVWRSMFSAATVNPNLWSNPAYQYDVVDVTRQVMSNSFNDLYTNLVSKYTSSASSTTLQAAGTNLTSLLATLDTVLSTNAAFSLSTWISSSRSQTSNTTLANFYEYNARNQITLWGPTGQINDYASKTWGGLVSSYYLPRWEIFTDYLVTTPFYAYNTTILNGLLLEWGEAWGNMTGGAATHTQGLAAANLTTVLGGLSEQWPEIFGS